MERRQADGQVAAQARENMVAVLPAIALIYGVLGALYVIAPPLHPGWPYAVSTLGVAAAQGLLGWWVRRAPLAAVHAIGFLAAMLAVAHALSFVALTRDPAQTVVLIMVLLGASFEMLTGWATLATVAVALAAWAWIARDIPTAAFVHWMVNLAATGALGLVITTARTRAIQRQIAADRALRESEERHRLVVDGAFDAIVTVDTDQRVVGWNPQAERVFGWAASEILGRRMATDLLAPEHRAGYERSVERFLATGDSPALHHLMVVTAVRRDGGTFTAEMTTTPIRRDGGWVFTAFVRDITDRKRAEDDLLRAKEAAEAGARVKSDFLATMSHEIRTPLNGIFGMTELALDTSDDGERREFLQRARVCAETLMTILNDVLDFSRVEAGRLDLERIAFDPRDVVDGVLDTLAVEADRKGLELIGCVDERLPAALVGDPGRLRQILINLAGNALKFTERGEVVIRLAIAPGAGGAPAETPPAGTSADGDAPAELTLFATVRDTGIGIAPDKQRAIFEAFTQADSSMTRRFGGTGLGLAISQRLVKLMGGTIGVDSVPDAGSRFWFTARHGVGGPPIATAMPALHGAFVSVMSSNAASARHLEHTLRAAGARALVTSTIGETLAELHATRAHGERFDALVIDLPSDVRETPWHLAMLEREHADLPPLVVLAPTAARGELLRVGGIRPELLSKPVKTRALLACLAGMRASATGGVSSARH
ncbi:MAG: PAS domain S-box protein [Deltaproteobacteria bacterium]|nr:PAS domain S-box protein [Deltaproteobacteria bacterium]